MKPRLPLRRPSAAVVALPLLALAAYGPFLATGFAAEDFLILGFLHRGGLASVSEQLVTPWLGLCQVGFHRPVSTALLALELAVFGPHAPAFHLAHVLVHGGAAVLVWRIVRRLLPAEPLVPVATASLWTLYPLHHGAVLFVGGFATLFGAVFVLLTVDRFLAGRRLAALAAFAAALGSYEAAAVVPAVLAVLAVAAPRPDARRPAELRATLPFWGLLAGWLLVRRAVLGSFIGGYAATRERTVPTMLHDLVTSVPRLFVPDGRIDAALEVGLAVLAGLAFVTTLLLRDARRPTGPPLLGAWLSGFAWAVVFQAPFAFETPVPANGRFWTFASVGSCLALAVAWVRCVRPLGPGPTSPRRLLATALPLGLLALFFAHLLRVDLQRFDDADHQVETLRGQIVAASTPGQRAHDGPLLIAGVPDFATDERGRPVAKVLHHGLADLGRPPFAVRTTPILRLGPEVRPGRWAELAVASGGTVHAWRPAEGRLVPAASRTVRPGPELLASELAGSAIRYACGDCSGVRLLIVNPGTTWVEDRPAGPDGRGVVPLPLDFLGSMASLYDGAVWAWLEVRDADGRFVPSAATFHELELADFSCGG